MVNLVRVLGVPKPEPWVRAAAAGSWSPGRVGLEELVVAVVLLLERVTDQVHVRIEALHSPGTGHMGAELGQCPACGGGS